jgi:uncharacterized membrane protein YhaH (DUF805 family)
MEQLTPETMIAVFEEIFGGMLFWAMLAAAVIVTVLYLYVLIRDRAMSMRKFLLSQLSMPIGAIAAVWFVLAVTHSHLRDMGGAVDVIVLLGIAAMGAIGMAILVYTAQSLFRGAARQ